MGRPIEESQGRAVPPRVGPRHPPALRPEPGEFPHPSSPVWRSSAVLSGARLSGLGRGGRSGGTGIAVQKIKVIPTPRPLLLPQALSQEKLKKGGRGRAASRARRCALRRSFPPFFWMLLCSRVDCWSARAPLAVQSALLDLARSLPHLAVSFGRRRARPTRDAPRRRAPPRGRGSP